MQRLLRQTVAKRIFIAVLFLIGAYWPILVFLEFETIATRDIGVLWAAGHAVRAGVDPYNVEAFEAFAKQLAGVANNNFPYPPHSFFLFVPLSYLPPLIAPVVWNGLSAIFFWWCARPLMPKGMPAILAVLTPAALINFNYGQTGLIVSGLFLLAFRGQGLAAAALTVKPQLGFLVIPALLRDKRQLTIAVVATLALIGVSAVAFGLWYEFANHARFVHGNKLASLTHIVWMLKGTTPAIGYGIWGWIPYALGASYILSRNYNVFTAATATFLISPYGLHYDMAALCLGFIILLHSRWEVMPLADKIAASLSFLSPVIVVYATTWVIPPIILWGLVVQTRWTEGVRLQIKSGQKGSGRLRLILIPAVPK